MRFVITRGSQGIFKPSLKSPCEGAEFNPEMRRWEIDLDSLESLIDLIKIVDVELIVGVSDKGIRQIEIYDDFR